MSENEFHPLFGIAAIADRPADYLARIGRVFALFGESTQDSGNVSYGIEVNGERYFVKTAGDPDNPKPYLKHPERVALLQNAVRLAQGCAHPALPRLYGIIESPHGPLLVYEWLEAELLHSGRAVRNDPQSPFQRFRRLPVPHILACLDVVYDLHLDLARRGWIAVDFYDGCLLYDFAVHRTRVVDLDHYRQGPFHNEMGRMFGSTRFMAPEEFELGAAIDERTTVFTLGRSAAVFLSDGTLDRGSFRTSPDLHRVVVRACEPDPAQRFSSVPEFHEAWHAARTAP